MFVFLGRGGRSFEGFGVLVAVVLGYETWTFTFFRGVIGMLLLLLMLFIAFICKGDTSPMMWNDGWCRLLLLIINAAAAAVSWWAFNVNEIIIIGIVPRRRSMTNTTIYILVYSICRCWRRRNGIVFRIIWPSGKSSRKVVQSAHPLFYSFSLAQNKITRCRVLL